MAIGKIWLWVLVSFAVGLLVAGVIYSRSPATEIAHVETATILADARTLEVRGFYDMGLPNRSWPVSTEMHIAPWERDAVDDDGLIVWVTVERIHSKGSTLAACLETASDIDVETPLLTAGINAGGAGPTTVTREGCREVFTTVMADPVDRDTAIKLLGPGDTPPIPVYQVRTGKGAKTGALVTAGLIFLVIGTAVLRRRSFDDQPHRPSTTDRFR